MSLCLGTEWVSAFLTGASATLASIVSAACDPSYFATCFLQQPVMDAETVPPQEASLTVNEQVCAWTMLWWWWWVKYLCLSLMAYGPTLRRKYGETPPVPFLEEPPLAASLLKVLVNKMALQGLLKTSTDGAPPPLPQGAHSTGWDGTVFGRCYIKGTGPARCQVNHLSGADGTVMSWAGILKSSSSCHQKLLLWPPRSQLVPLMTNVHIVWKISDCSPNFFIILAFLIEMWPVQGEGCNRVNCFYVNPSLLTTFLFQNEYREWLRFCSMFLSREPNWNAGCVWGVCIGLDLGEKLLRKGYLLPSSFLLLWQPVWAVFQFF